jgi:hypothetical protein
MEVLEETAPGTGGMGRLYRARETALDRIVAVKTIREHLLTAEGRAFFVREARAVARLNHPNIVKIHGFNPDYQPPYYVMEFVEGRPLDVACAGRPVAHIVEILEKVARALAYAHARGVVHRDIKPANILVDFQNEPHLADFGLAQKWDDAALEGGSTDSLAAGTPLFLAPELYQAGAAAAPTADIFALGVTMYRLLTGRYPFVGKTRDEVRRSMLADDPPLLQELNPEVPEPLQRICLKAIEKDPDARYASAEAFADDLRRFREGREVFARPTRYEAELRGKLRNHVTEIQLWLRHHLIDVREMDRLVRPYRKLIDAEFPWHDLARRFPWETAILRLGGWLVVVGTILWPRFYWERLASHERLLAVGGPTLLLNLVGWFFHRRRNRSTAFIFLSLGAVLLPLFGGVVLTEYRLLRYPQSEARELFREAGALSDAEIEDGLAKFEDGLAKEAASAEGQGVGLTPQIVPTNMQLTLAMSAFVAYLFVLLALTRVRAFAIWTGVGLYALFTTVLLRCGLLEWVSQHQVARVFLCYIGLALAFLVLSLVLEWRRRSEWAASFYLLFPGPFVFCMSYLAFYGVDEWLRALPDEVKGERFFQWLMANGIVYLGAALWSARVQASYIRFWGNFFMLLVPVSLLVPLDFLWRMGKGWDIIPLPNGWLSSYALLSFLVSAILVAAGTRTRRYQLALSGLAGLAAFVYLVTVDHFLRYLSWPLGLTVAGGITMAVAVAFLVIKARRRPHEAI